jgi:hypothetical protein
LRISSKGLNRANDLMPLLAVLGRRFSPLDATEVVALVLLVCVVVDDGGGDGDREAVSVVVVLGGAGLLSPQSSAVFDIVESGGCRCCGVWQLSVC